MEAKKSNKTKEEEPKIDEEKTSQIVHNSKETTQGHDKEINRNKANTSQNVQDVDEESFTKVTKNRSKKKKVSTSNKTRNSNVVKGKGKMDETSTASLIEGSSIDIKDKIVEEGNSEQSAVENDHMTILQKSNLSRLPEKILKRFQLLLRKSRVERVKNNNNTQPLS